MIKTTMEDCAMVYDEVGWGDITFHDTEFCKQLIKNKTHDIYQVEFLNIERVITIRFNDDTTYWFRDIDLDLLNFLCKWPEFYIPVKRFFIKGHNPMSFSVSQYPLLAAVLLGNNNQH